MQPTPACGGRKSAAHNQAKEVFMSRTAFTQWLILVTTVVALSWSPVARGDAGVDWNTIAFDTISAAPPARPGPVGFLDIAVVQVAIYDAVQAIGGKYK